MKRLGIWLLLALALGACRSGVPVTLDNQSEFELGAVQICGTGFKASLGVVAAGESRTVRVYPSGDSDLALSFVANGLSYSYEPQGYFEAGGMYKVSAVVEPDLTVLVHSSILP